MKTFHFIFIKQHIYNYINRLILNIQLTNKEYKKIKEQELNPVLLLGMNNCLFNYDRSLGIFVGNYNFRCKNPFLFACF